MSTVFNVISSMCTEIDAISRSTFFVSVTFIVFTNNRLVHTKIASGNFKKTILCFLETAPERIMSEYCYSPHA